MAVARVFGRIDGAETVFSLVGGRWQVPVPLDQDGEYAVEIVAEDEAGNQSYMAKLLFCVNSAMLCVTVMPEPYYAELLPDIYTAGLLPETFTAELLTACCRGGG